MRSHRVLHQVSGVGKAVPANEVFYLVQRILTGQRSVLEYLLDPFLAASRTALRER